MQSIVPDACAVCGERAEARRDGLAYYVACPVCAQCGGPAETESDAVDLWDWAQAGIALGLSQRSDGRGTGDGG